MNGKELLEKIDFTDMSFVEEAAYPGKNKTARCRKIALAAACIAAVLSLCTIVYATDTVSALRAYFTPQSTEAEALLQGGTLTAADGKASMRIDGRIADENAFLFTVSVSGTGEKLSVGDALETVWVTDEGEPVTDFSRQYGAYTGGFAKGFGSSAAALSLYDDADATFSVFCDVPEGYSVYDMKAVEVTCAGMTLSVDIEGCIIPTYTLSPKNGSGAVSDFTASAIGFRFTADSEENDVSLIRRDGSYFGDGDEGWNGYFGGVDTLGGGKISVYGFWGGDDAIAVGIIDLDMYKGISVNGTDYFFDR